MIILASSSPRRQEILSNFVNIVIKTKEIEENNEEYESPEQLVMALSFEKGIEVAMENKEDIVLSADTVVSIDEKIYGKPKTREEAFNMLKTFSGREQEVLTGYSIFKTSEKIKVSNYEKSIVKFKELDDETINDYLDTLEYTDKAGAYTINGYGRILIESIIGDFDNIVGLPISKISDEFKSLFNISMLKEVRNEKK